MRSTRERIVHTALFELMAIAIATPVIAWLTGAPVADAGGLSVLLSAGAVVSNYVWTLVFDRFVPTRHRGLAARAGHAIGLEIIVSLYTIPFVMLFTDASFGRALLIDLIGIGFFVLFGMAYNAAFDAVMLRLLREM